VSIWYESNQRNSIYDSRMDDRWFEVKRYYSLTYPYRVMEQLHAHMETEIMYVVSGQCIINLEETTVGLQEGEYIFIDSLIPHSLTVERGHPCRILNIEAGLVESDSLLRFVAMSRDVAFRKLRDSRLPWFHDQDEHHAVRDAILNLHRLLQRQDSKMEVDLQLSLILLEICHQHFIDHVKQPKGKPTYVKRAIRFIDEHFDRELSIDEITEAAGISKAHLQRSFVKSEGCTLVEAINERRLAKARFLLASTGMPVVEIANEVGFSSRQYFTSLFSRAAGMTPAAYRAKQRGNLAIGFNGADMGVAYSSRGS